MELLEGVLELEEELLDCEEPELDCDVLGSAGAGGGVCASGGEGVDALPPQPNVDNNIIEAVEKRIVLRTDESRGIALTR